MIWNTEEATTKTLTILSMLSNTLDSAKKAQDMQVLDDLLEALAEVSQRGLIRIAGEIDKGFTT